MDDKQLLVVEKIDIMTAGEKAGEYMLNYANLNDVEFEALCRDIMERILGVGLRRFGSGRDGGVDLTDDVENKSIIVQVKHYIKSDVKALISSLKKELPKVNEHCPEQYYICCSRELSHSNVNELYQCFREYMVSDRNIITRIEIDEFLKNIENIDILKKHYKLWLDSTGILEDICSNRLFVDCEAFLYDVKELHKLFVQTSAFDRALNVLENNHTLCIIGDPGVGKSITSKMIVLNYAANGYRVRYTTDVADLTTLKASLRSDSTAKEIILLDDCFGQAYFEMKSSQSAELVTLIKYVKNNPNKKLILNSRVTIFQEAKERQRELIRCLDGEDFKVFILDINNLSDEEKAKVFYNHLAFHEIPDEYFQNILVDRRYRKIVCHRNYNPRIIEHVCTPSQYKTIPADEFFSFIQKHLDNPNEMWSDEYDNRLRPEDRILLQTIYSLTVTSVNISIVRKCFERRIESIPAIDKTLDQFNRSLKRLSDGFIKLVDKNGKKYVSMLNPSVNDFLDGRLKNESTEKKMLVKSICTPGQMRLIPEEDRLLYVKNLLETGDVDKLIFESPKGVHSKAHFIGCCIKHAEIFAPQYCSEFQEYLLEDILLCAYPSAFFPSNQEPLSIISNSKTWECYNLIPFFEEADHLYTFLMNFDFEDGVEIILACDKYFDSNRRFLYSMQVESYLNDILEDYEVDAFDYDFYVDVEQAVNNSAYEGPDCIEYDVQMASALIEDEVKEIVAENLYEMANKLPKQFLYVADSINTSNIYVSGADSMVESFLSEPPGYIDYDDYSHLSYDSDYSSIDAIFER